MQPSDVSFGNTRNKTPSLLCNGIIGTSSSFRPLLPLPLVFFCLFVDEDVIDKEIQTYDENVIKQ